MSRIRVNIDHLVLKGFEPGNHKAFVEGLQAELSRVLADPATRAQWDSSKRTPVLKLARTHMESRHSGERK